jgi:hypothetical protein
VACFAVESASSNGSPRIFASFGRVFPPPTDFIDGGAKIVVHVKGKTHDGTEVEADSVAWTMSATSTNGVAMLALKAAP